MEVQDGAEHLKIPNFLDKIWVEVGGFFVKGCSNIPVCKNLWTTFQKSNES